MIEPKAEAVELVTNLPANSEFDPDGKRYSQGPYVKEKVPSSNNFDVQTLERTISEHRIGLDAQINSMKLNLDEILENNCQKIMDLQRIIQNEINKI
ncbi:hypothetical protein [Marinomonas sp.]|uniref:hypothetical protein n=1 Tax=Marinomonas sp. TaxID=1904862 RepID=UPI003BAAEEE0